MMQCNHLEPTTASNVKWYTVTYIHTSKYCNHLAHKIIYFNISMGLNSVTDGFFSLNFHLSGSYMTRCLCETSLMYQRKPNYIKNDTFEIFFFFFLLPFIIHSSCQHLTLYATFPFMQCLTLTKDIKSQWILLAETKNENKVHIS